MRDPVCFIVAWVVWKYGRLEVSLRPSLAGPSLAILNDWRCISQWALGPGLRGWDGSAYVTRGSVCMLSFVPIGGVDVAGVDTLALTATVTVVWITPW